MKKILDDSWGKGLLKGFLEGVIIEKKEYINIFRTPEFKKFLSTLTGIDTRDDFIDNFGLDLWDNEKIKPDSEEYLIDGEDIYYNLIAREKLSLHLGENKSFIRVTNNLNDKYHKLSFEQLWYLCKWINVNIKEYLPRSIHDDISREKHHYDEIKIRNSENPEYESIWWDFKELELSLCKRICEESIYFSELRGRELQIYIFYNSCEERWRRVANQFLPILEDFSISTSNIGKAERFSYLCKKDSKNRKVENEKLESDQQMEVEKKKYFESCTETFDGTTLEMYVNMAKDKDKNCLRMIRAYRFARNEENEKHFDQLIKLLNFGHRDSRNNETNRRVNRLCYNVNRKF